MNNQDNTLCGCETCVTKRINALPQDRTIETIMSHSRGPGFPGWRYCCELCGNKRCPHHTNHILECTNSNAPGQKGSSWEFYNIGGLENK